MAPGLELRIERVGGDREFGAHLELHRAVEAEARAVDDELLILQQHRGREHAATRAGVVAVEEIVALERLGRRGTLLIFAGDHDADAAVGELGRREAGDRGFELVGVFGIDALRAHRDRRLLERQRLRGDEIDRTAKPALCLAGERRLADFEASEQAGGHRIEPRRAAELVVLGRRQTRRPAEQGAAVDLDADLLQAAHRHRLAFAEDAGDLDAGDALQRLGDVRIGKLADVLGGDHVHHLRRVTLDVGGLFERGANARDDDFLVRRIGRTATRPRLRGGRHRQRRERGAARQSCPHPDARFRPICHFSLPFLRHIPALTKNDTGYFCGQAKLHTRLS